MTRDEYDKLLIRWMKGHYWDSLEPNKDLILRHMRTFVGDAIYSDEPQEAKSTSDPGGCKFMRCIDLKDGVCHYKFDYCKYRPEDADA